MKKITDKSNNLLAIVIDYESIDKEKNFVTDNSSDIQLASFNLKKNTIIENHYHPKQDRKIETTCEVLVVLDGVIEITIYDKNLEIVSIESISKGGTVALFDGGHGIKVVEDCKLIETKQGPYNESTDKVRF